MSGGRKCQWWVTGIVCSQQKGPAPGLWSRERGLPALMRLPSEALFLRIPLFVRVVCGVAVLVSWTSDCADDPCHPRLCHLWVYQLERTACHHHQAPTGGLSPAARLFSLSVQEGVMSSGAVCREPFLYCAQRSLWACAGCVSRRPSRAWP